MRAPLGLSIILTTEDDQYSGFELLERPLTGLISLCMTRARAQPTSPRFYQAMQQQLREHFEK